MLSKVYFCLMIKIENQIISLDIIEKHFTCDLNSCKGSCCVDGDSGAPITNQEKDELEKIYKKIIPYMNEEGMKSIEKDGIAIYDDEGDLTTTLVKNKECAFVFFEKGIAKCSIEKAYLEKRINFRKPISCHLFPLRITKYKDFEGLNFEKLDICQSACNCGEKLKIPLYVFLKKPLIRKYGDAWYNNLVEAIKTLDK